MKLNHKEYLLMAKQVAETNSADPNTKTGAIIVKTGEVLPPPSIVAKGWNHFPVPEGNGITWNREGEYLDTKYPYVVHAEIDCIVKFLRYVGMLKYRSHERMNYYNPEDYTMYMTLFPCEHCAQMIILSGIKKFYYADDKYHDKEFSIAARRLFDVAGVEYIYLPIEDECEKEMK